MTASEMKMWASLAVCCFFSIIAASATGVAQQRNVQGSLKQQQQKTQVHVLESAAAVSEVEYVDGPLAPLYDFLIQKRLQRFCKLLRDAGLEQVIQELGGSFTLFVPTDASFIFLPGGTLEELQRNPQLLRDFILYHFVTGDFPSSQIQNEILVDSVQGSPLRFNIYGQIFTVSGAQIVEPDLQFELGRVHVVDHPLYPIPTADIVSYLQSSHKEFYRLLIDAGLGDYLSSSTFTLLVPDDQAFSYLSLDLKDALATNRSLAERVLLNHVLPGSVYISGIVDGSQMETMGGAVIAFTINRGLTFANGIPIVLPDVSLTNGVVHVLNRVLLPDGVENDCHCKPASDTNQGSSSQSSRSPFVTTPRPGFTTRRSQAQPFQRQTPRPSWGQSPNTIGQRSTPGQATQRPGRPSSVQRHPTPPRNVQTPRPLPPPIQVTRSPYDQPEPQPEDDINSVVGPEPQPGSQKRPDQARTTRYPPPPRRGTPPRPQSQRYPTHSPRTQTDQQPSAGIGNDVKYPEQELSTISTRSPTTNRWSNRQQTTPRYPTPARGPYRTPATTRRPQTTRSYNRNVPRVTQPPSWNQPNQDSQEDYSYSTDSGEQELQTQKPVSKVPSWQQRKQVTKATRQPSQQTTSRPARYPPPPQRRPTPPRPGNFITPAPPIETDQPFESNRQRPSCRRPGDRVTPSTQSLPLCPQSDSDQCQNSPFDPSDPRPLCPEDTGKPDCRDPNEQFDPSDSRPVCPSTGPTPDCRVAGQPTFAGDRRPLCSQSPPPLPPPPPQTGCRDPSAPYNPSDRRPLCRSTAPPRLTSPQTQDINNQQGCRRPEEPTNPQDIRPLCPEETQQDCRPFLERPKPGDRRPVCKVNRQPSQRPQPVNDIDKGQNRVRGPQRQPSYPQNGRYPTSQTTRRQSWQPTTQIPQQPYEQTNIPNQQVVGKQPQPGGTLRPPQRPGSPTSPQPGSHQSQPHFISQGQTGAYPSQPQTGSHPSQPQPGSYPSRPQTDAQPHAGPHGGQPQSGSYPSQPQTGSYPSQPQTGSLPGQPQSGTYPSQPPLGSYPSQSPSGSYPNQPQVGSRPPSQPPSRSYPHQSHTGSRPPAQPHTGIQSPQPPSGYPPSSPGSPPSQPQSNNYPSRPQPSQPNIPSTRYPQVPSQPQTRPQSLPSPPRQGTYPPPPQTGFTPSIPPAVHQTGSHPSSPGACIRCPNQQSNQPGFSDIRPNQQLTPQRQPIGGQGQQVSFTPAPGRGSAAPRVPVSVTGTSTTPSEDARRTLYEIVEDPALLIRGRPIKLTKIFSLFHKAGIEDILTGPGPTTVFLPSDDAFATLPKGVVDQLEENPDLLRQVLLYHVTASEILPSAEGGSFAIPSLEGTQLVITMLNGGRLILISGAKAVAVTRANNGIFYVVNQLLYPLPHANIVGAIQSRPDLSTLAWLLPLSGLTELLQGQTPYTILAPTDNAFAQLPSAVYDELTKNTTALQELLLNHIIEGAHYGREFLTGATFPSARGGKLKFQVVSYGYQVNDVNIKTPEIVTGTGVIHLVDQVLLEEPDLQFFNSLDNSLNGQGFTLGNNAQQPPVGNFQPPPAQPLPFSQAPPTGVISPVGNRPPLGQPQVTGLQPTFVQQPPTGQLPTHGQQPPAGQNPIHGQQPPTGQIPTRGQQPFTGQRPVHGQQPPTGQIPTHGQRPPATQPQAPSPAPFRGQQPPPAQPQTPRQPSHGVQRPAPGQQTFVTGRQPVFQPQSPGHSFPPGASSQGMGPSQNGGSNNDVADLARSMGLNRFANWISNTGLLEKIHDGGVYTVFAPTDDAVSSLPQEMIYSIDTNPDQVKNLLQYHIVPQRLNLNALSNEETASTLLQGKKIRFNVYENVHPDCKQLVTASGTPIGEPLANMGSVQVIPVTQVLYQPAGNLLNIVEASPILRKLAEAVRTARLTWVLSGNGPLTIFAPSDTAFESLSDEQRKTMIEDKQAFAELLKRHMVRGTYFSSGVQEDLEKKSENGQQLTMSLHEGVMTVNSVPVTYSDITATNGVLHVIDQFL